MKLPLAEQIYTKSTHHITFSKYSLFNLLFSIHEPLPLQDIITDVKVSDSTAALHFMS